MNFQTSAMQFLPPTNSLTASTMQGHQMTVVEAGKKNTVRLVVIKKQ
jgi:hypothetical protein